MSDSKFDDNWDPARDARVRRMRNIALGLVLTGIGLLFFLMTMVRLGGQVANWFD
ncbi:MAG TPA: hypothetical protein VGG48_00260 [Rhizomicrobium sp.]